jgi:hypothetical protein
MGASWAEIATALVVRGLAKVLKIAGFTAADSGISG